MEESFLFSNIDCKKEYYFVILLYQRYNSFEYFPSLLSIHFNIIDSNINIIKLSPELSDIFSFHQRDKENQEIVSYYHNETKYGLFSFSFSAKIQIFKNSNIIYDKGEKDYNTPQI